MTMRSLKTMASQNEGAALLTVLVALLLISLITLELQYTSLVERKLAYNDLNKIQTHYLAKSGIRLGLLRLSAFGKVTKRPGNLALGKPYFNLIWSIPFPPYPPEKASLENLSLQEKSEQLEALKDTRITTGKFSYTISSEASKLNLNLISDSAGTGFKSLPTAKGAGAIGGFIGYTLYQKIVQIFKDSDSPVDEFGNVRPEDIIENLVEWVSPPGQSAARDNSGWYERQVPPYKPKHGRFFTLDEVKLVKDMSPALFLKLKPYVTVFSEEGKINLTEATQRNALKLYFPRITDYSLKLVQDEFAKLLSVGQTGWGSVGDFFKVLERYDPVSASEYPSQIRDEFFTVESTLFVVRSKGSIQKSGSTIESNLTVAVAFDPPRYRSPFPVHTTESACENRPSFNQGVWLGGKCVYPPFDAQECLSEGLTLCKNPKTGNKDGCFALRDGGLDTTSGSPTCFVFPERAANAPPLWGGVKVYSWVES